MIELIMVMVLIGILGAVAMGRFFDRKGFDADGFAEQSRAMLRYAQKVAVAQNRAVYVRLNGTSVALCFEPACAAANRVLPAAGANSGSSATLAACGNTAAWACEAKPAGITYVLAPTSGYGSGDASYFYFDAQGKPYASANSYPSAMSSFLPLTITVAGDGGSRSITVEQETGYVH